MCRSGRKTPVARACDPEPRDRRAVPARLEWPAPTHRPGAGSLRCCSVVMPRRPDMNIVPTLDTETAQKLDDELWFKDVIIYQLHVKAFQDSKNQEAQAYYWHRFFSHQPDLNFDNPRVVKAVLQVMKRCSTLASTGSASTQCLISVSARAPATRTCPKRMRCCTVYARRSTNTPPTRCCWRRPISGRKTCRLILARATSATWPITSR